MRTGADVDVKSRLQNLFVLIQQDLTMGKSFVVLINVETLLRARPTQHYDITRIIALLPIGGPIVPTGI